MENGSSIEVALIGEGRRGRLLCRELAAMGRIRKVHLVSRQNARGLYDWLACENLSHRVELHAKLDPVLWDPGIAAAVVASDPAERFATARWLLENGKHVLVEQFAGPPSEAQALIGLAAARGLTLALDTQSPVPLASFLEEIGERRVELAVLVTEAASSRATDPDLQPPRDEAPRTHPMHAATTP
jgi:hypothetical protein